jgi:hypothetical protein
MMRLGWIRKNSRSWNTAKKFFKCLYDVCIFSGHDELADFREVKKLCLDYRDVQNGK